MKFITLLLSFDPFCIEDLLKAHGALMPDFRKFAGRFRSGDVGVLNEEQVVHIAPKKAVGEFMTGRSYD